MITLRVIQSRMRRRLILELSEENYVSSQDILTQIPYLEKFKSDQFLFGIKESDRKWTVLSASKLYASYNGEPFEIVLNRDADKIHHFYGDVGDKQSIDVELEDGRKIWMKSVGLSCSIQNIILMLQDLPDDVFLLED